MFKKILIANRGEIACRIMSTCQEMGVGTIGVYSEADASALHVEMADESVCIGPPVRRESYLNHQIIIDTALALGAEAIHPGYGFLSENPNFARAVQDAGLVFIGPSPDVIKLMGDKLQAKALAKKAGVSMIPGSEASVTTAQEVKSYAKEFGYPVLLKAAAGGGGKGMRVVHQEGQIEDALKITTHEAMSSFGDGRIFVEKYLEDPRHIEIQILADLHGNMVHLGERDCSLQRRHQKVVEESPSPFMTPSLRNAIAEQALALARQAGYTSAGTVEFMVTPDHSFYFLEMNTRLQVEHPVTEMITGIDLVEQMIRIAAGERLSLTQSQVSFSGHAVEGRIYAEDPSEDFMPSSGRITRFEPPPLGKGLRLDTGVDAGSEVSVYYDPMIAKLISWAPSREKALDQLKDALGQFIIEGPVHNLGFLEQLLYHPKVEQGDFSTHYIEQNMHQDPPKTQTDLMTAVAAKINKLTHSYEDFEDWIVVSQGVETPVKVKDPHVFVGKKKIEVDLLWHPREKRFVVKAHGGHFYGQVYINEQGINLKLFGIEDCFKVMRPRVWNLYSHIHPPQSKPDYLVVKAPMPGILVSFSVGVGDRVKYGQPLLVIEAMKMENILKSPTDAVVEEVLTQPGDTLVRNQILVKLGKTS